MAESGEEIYGNESNTGKSQNNSKTTPGGNKSDNQPYAKYRDSPLVLTIWEDKDQVETVTSKQICNKYTLKKDQRTENLKNTVKPVI